MYTSSQVCTHSWDHAAGSGDGVNLTAIGNAIIEEVRYMVEKCTGTQVRAVNVYIDSLVIG